MQMNTLLEMTEIVVPDNIQRKIMCPKHEGKTIINETDRVVYLVCKHCGKGMAKCDDENLFFSLARTKYYKRQTN